MKILASPAFVNKKINPYNALLYGGITAAGETVDEYSHAKLLKGGYDIVHYHWPDGFINARSLPKALSRTAILLFSILWCRIRNMRIVWTVHNMMPHDPHHPWLSRQILSYFSRSCSGLVFLSKHSRDEFFKVYDLGSKKPATAVIAHGHYKTVYPPKMPKEQARKTLGLEASGYVVLFFGMIKPYKNITGLLQAFARWGDQTVSLIIAGNPSDAQQKTMIEEAASADKRIHPVLRFIPDNDIPLYMGASDMMVLPYTNILNSGAILLGLSYDVPVLVPALGSMVELQAGIGPDWVRTFEGDLGAEDLCQTAARFQAAGAGRTCDLARYDWHALAVETAGFYREILAQPL